jgi:hypothetical protein
VLEDGDNEDSAEEDKGNAEVDADKTAPTETISCNMKRKSLGAQAPAVAAPAAAAAAPAAAVLLPRAMVQQQTLLRPDLARIYVHCT